MAKAKGNLKKAPLVKMVASLNLAKDNLNQEKGSQAKGQGNQGKYRVNQAKNQEKATKRVMVLRISILMNSALTSHGKKFLK